MQEPMLHGWRLSDGEHIPMSSYDARVRSLSWSAGGEWLATSGATQLVLWPFHGKDGPMGKTPRLLTPTDYRIDVVACHPRKAVVAAGYGNGLILLTRIDNAIILAKNVGDAPVSALAWSADGYSSHGARKGARPARSTSLRRGVSPDCDDERDVETKAPPDERGGHDTLKPPRRVSPLRFVGGSREDYK